MLIFVGTSTLWILLQLCIPGVNLQTITVIPRNTADLANSTVTLECGFTDEPTTQVKWREFITNPADGSVISIDKNKNSGYPGGASRAARYNILNPSGKQYNLQISPLTTEDAGYYRCSGDSFENTKYGLAVLYLRPKTCSVTQSGRVTDTVVEGEQFTLRCQREYRSFPGWPPALSWVGFTSLRNITTETQITYEVDLTAADSMDQATFQCTSIFTNPPPFKPGAGVTDDTRLPTYTEPDCETTPIQVHWSPKAITRSSPEQQAFFPGDSLTCFASANPAPITFGWNKLNGSGPQGSPTATLPITAEMLGDNGYECIVTNKVRNVVSINSHNFTFKVEPKPATTFPTLASHSTDKSQMTAVKECFCPTETHHCPTAVESQPSSCGPGFIPGFFTGLFIGIVLIFTTFALIWLLKHNRKKEKTKSEEATTTISNIAQIPSPASVNSRSLESEDYEEVTELQVLPSVEAGVTDSEYQQLHGREAQEKEYAKLQAIYQNSTMSNQQNG